MSLNVNNAQIGQLFVHLADLLQAGCPLSRALDAIARQSSNTPLAKLCKSLNNEIINGQSLAGAMDAVGETFTMVQVSMIRAAEEGGFLQQTLASMADHAVQHTEVIKQVKAKLAYPLMLAVTIFVSIIFLMTFVVPRFARIYESTNQELPAITKALMSFSGFITAHWLGLIITIAVACILMQRVFKIPALKKYTERFILKLPVFAKVISDWETYRFAQTMGLLLTGGVKVVRALRLSRDVAGNSVVRAEIDMMADAVETGKPLSDTMQSSMVFDTTTMEMILVSETTGKLGPVLNHLSAQRKRDFQIRIDTLLSLLEPAIIVIMALIVGITVSAMLLPVLTMNSLVA